ncbi:hypothetical protein CSOJ01_14454 [Colletotrichum sojae]|uniref:Uncharacterized protein n=1 Tax=Colletotrichum sojae TaxID=2175907 RepID=A0A8H6IPR6_9PEZI|nr:hypothetical protein CSOJ01_14454 [Colletotrichum sojae]
MGFEHLEQLLPAVPTAAEPHWHILDGSERAATEETGMMGAGILVEWRACLLVERRTHDEEPPVYIEEYGRRR